MVDYKCPACNRGLTYDWVYQRFRFRDGDATSFVMVCLHCSEVISVSVESVEFEGRMCAEFSLAANGRE